MSQFLYSLEKYKNPASNIECTGCGQKRLRPYINNATGERLGNHVGRCERSDECQYHFTTKQFFEQNPESKPGDFEKWKPVPPPPRPVSFIDKAIFKKSLGLNNSNTFTNFLIVLFGKKRAEVLVDKYHIGTTKNGEAIFYQVDLQGNVRSGKVMKYNLTASDQTALGKDCKRDKTTFPNWVHSKLKLENFNLKQCLFGQHLINDGKTIAVVESEKSAIIASVYFQNFVWVACGGKEGLSIEKLKVLKGKNVVLFSDLNGIEKWNLKAIEMRAFYKSVTVSDLLEQVATVDERASGLDIADYLLRLSAPETLPAVATEPEPSSTVTTDTQICAVVENDEIVKHDLIAIHYTPSAVEEIPFWEDVVNSDTPLTDLEIRAKLVAEWFTVHGSVFDGTFILDNLAIPDIRKVIVHHLQIIDKNESSSVLSTKFLERVKVAFMGA